MKASIQLLEGSSFAGTSGSGHSVTLDVAPEAGGRNQGIRPMEMILLGLGGCTAIDVLQMLRKGRSNVTDLRVEVSGERANEVPRVFETIHVHFTVRGDGLNAAKVERAIELSANKYCSATTMLGQVVEITHDFEIVSDEDKVSC